MISAKIESALNEQLNREMYSAYLYMSMSTQASLKNLKGFASWFMVQYHEEMFHAMKIYQYILRQGGEPQLMEIKKPASEFSSPLDMFVKTLEHEKYITKSIHTLMDLAVSEKDYATQIFMQWYVNEQIEEEENDNEIIAMLKMVDNSPQATFMIDRQLNERKTTVPTDYSKDLAE